MHWLGVKTQPVYVSYNPEYQCEALPTVVIMASGGLKTCRVQVLRFAPTLLAKSYKNPKASNQRLIYVPRRID